METNSLKIIKESITELMQDNNLDLQEFSSLSGISRSTLDGWMKEKHYPYVNQIITVADFFDCSVDYIFNLTDKKQYEKSKNREEFIVRFKERKQSLALTKYKIAAACNIDIACINKWERLGQKPRIDNLICLAKFFGCSADYLLGRSDKI